MVNVFELYESLTATPAPEAASEPVAQPHVTLDGGRVRMDFDAQQSSDFWGYVNAVKALPGRKYVGGTVNTVDATLGVLEVAERFGLVVTDEVRAACQQAARSAVEREADARTMLAVSRADDAELDVPDTVALTPRPYQRAGIAYALQARRTFIADEQGLGKTLQAQVAVEIEQAFPALVVCKAKLRGNWRMEIGLTLPGRKVQVLEGQTPYPIDADAEFVVINFDIIWYWREVLIAHGFQALIVDESQYVKNHESKNVTVDSEKVRVYKTQRTRAVKEVADALPADSMRLLLTGTSMMNRPIELTPQLDILGRLDEFGGFFSFAKRYAAAQNNGYGWVFTGSSNEDELRTRLRSVCMVRRLKRDVASDIPDKNRVSTWLTLNGELVDYKRIWDEGPDDSQAGEMAWMSKLRRAVGIAKTAAAIEFVEEFIDTEQGEEPKSIVVFAHHKDVQQAIADHFGDNAVTIFAGDKDAAVTESKRRFQAGEVQVLVGSLEAASEGHTLTRAADVLMVERAWTPKREEQAEDRVHRIGQDRPVTIHYLLALDTLDEDMTELVESKRAVIDRVQDGDDSVLTDEEREVLELDVQQALRGRLVARRAA